MALVGLKYVVAAPVKAETLDSTTYDKGFVVGKAVSANLSVTTSAAKLYADDVLSEQDDSVTGGSLDLVVDNISDDIAAKFLGHTKSEDGEIISNSDDVALPHGVGFYAKKKVNGVLKYRAIWIEKVQFSEPSENLQTRGNNTQFVTPTLPGSISITKSGNWKTEQTFVTEAEAIAYLDGKAGIAAV